MRKIYNLFLSVIMLLATIQLSAQDFVAQITDANMTILITEGYSGDVELAEIGIFYTDDNGDLKCAGHPTDPAGETGNMDIPLPGETFMIAAMQTEQGLDNGMAPGEEFTWLARDVDGNPLQVDVTYLPGSESSFTAQTVSYVATLEISSIPADVSGCTNDTATNYNEDATIDDGSCQIEGCTDESALNYNADANVDDGQQCDYPVIDPLKITVTVCGDVAESVNMTGPWWSWDATAGPVASANADGTWTLLLILLLLMIWSFY